MPFILYRGDDRSPDQITNAQGFQARIPLPVITARQLITRVARNPHQEVNLPQQERLLRDALASPQFAGRLIGMLTLYREIVRETSQTTVHISTDKTPEAGGRGKAYLYRIEIPPNVSLYEWRTTPPRRDVDQPNPVSDTGQLISFTTQASLLTNTNDVDTADIIAAVSGNEVAFLTDIPLGWIRQYQERGQAVWINM